MNVAMPAVEIADHRDAAGIRRPYAEHRSHVADMGAKQAVSLEIAAFVEQVKRLRMLHLDPLSQYHKLKTVTREVRHAH